MRKSRVVLLKTVDDVIEAFGGTMQTARRFGAPPHFWPQTVSNWKRRQRLPPRLYDSMSAELAKLGYRAKPELWQQEKK